MPVLKRKGSKSLSPFWQTADGGNAVRLFLGDAIEVLKRLPARSVHCCVTSPPYWGLRDYGTGTWEGGDSGCDHVQKEARARPELVSGSGSGKGCLSWGERDVTTTAKEFCRKCGAKRLDQQLGSESTPDEYVARMVAVFREVRRVLRDDGTCWLNLGDTYAAGGGHTKQGENSQRKGRANVDAQNEVGLSNKSGLPSGNLVGVPWRVALALQADGWVLRQDIIWSKPSPMPESVRNRCTKAHEYVFLLTKGIKYYYDAEAIKEKAVSDSFVFNGSTTYKSGAAGDRNDGGPAAIGGQAQSSNKRSVWTVASAGYPGAHFATFPPKLIEPMIRAGTSEAGCCAGCGVPYERVIDEDGGMRAVEEERGTRDRSIPSNRNGITGSLDGVRRKRETAGWMAGCACGAERVPCLVLDPFMGSGTTAAVSVGLGRRCWGIDLSGEYLTNHAVPRVVAALRDRPRTADLGVASLIPELTPPKRRTAP